MGGVAEIAGGMAQSALHFKAIDGAGDAGMPHGINRGNPIIELRRIDDRFRPTGRRPWPCRSNRIFLVKALL
jgi:hypothetical protein